MHAPLHRGYTILEMIFQLHVTRNFKDYLESVTMATLRVVMVIPQDNHVKALGTELDKHSKNAIYAVLHFIN